MPYFAPFAALVLPSLNARVWGTTLHPQVTNTELKAEKTHTEAFLQRQLNLIACFEAAAADGPSGKGAVSGATRREF